MKTKKHNEQQNLRGCRPPPASPTGWRWSGPRGLPDDVSRGPRLPAVGTLPGRGSGAGTSPSRVTELSGERWPAPHPHPRSAAQRPVGSRVIGSDIAAGNKAGVTQLDGARGVPGTGTEQEGFWKAGRGTGRGEGAARLRRWRGTSPELWSRLRRSHSGCRRMTGTLAGRAGCGDAGELTPSLTWN